MALLAGKTSLAAIQRYGSFLTHSQRVWLDFPEKKNGRGRRTPSYKALYNLLGKLDPQAFAAVLSEWLAEHEGELPRALALDGKYVRDHVFEEDKTRSKNWRLNTNLALLRMAALRVRAELMPAVPWIQLAEKAQQKPAFVYQPVVNHRAK
jgi:hypothetical protein